MLLIKSQLNPDRIHLFRLNHGDNRAVASIFDTGRLSPQCGYHFDYSGEVILPVQETFLRNLNKIGDLINAKSPADAWLSDSGLNDLIPGPKIRNFLAMAFTEDWEGKVCNFPFKAFKKKFLQIFQTFFVIPRLTEKKNKFGRFFFSIFIFLFNDPYLSVLTGQQSLQLNEIITDLLLHYRIIERASVPHWSKLFTTNNTHGDRVH